MPHFRRIIFLLPLLGVVIISLACRQPTRQISIPTISQASATPDPGVVTATTGPSALIATPVPTKTIQLPIVRSAEDPSIVSPTPDVERELPTVIPEEKQYYVQAGDTLGIISAKFGIPARMIINANQLLNPDWLSIGQLLTIPAPVPGSEGSSFKIIPDSELVYGPYAQSFDINTFVSRFDSYLGNYTEQVDGQMLTGPQVVMLVAQEYSVNPRLLLAILEYQGGWVTKAYPRGIYLDYPMGFQDETHKGLFFQLSWAADQLNRGFYLWKVNGIADWILYSGESIPVDPTLNAGTIGVQQFFAQLYDRWGWDFAVSPSGLYATYSNFFGYPFDYAYDPLLPDGLEQPAMQLPFEQGVNWAFTGGPHGGWGSGSAWAALDFAPGSDSLGCVESNLWVVAVADGFIISADTGRVIQDLDGDGNEGTGWTVLYMHIEGRDRVAAGTYLYAGDRIGHPSCTGGYSTGTHFHLARRYNGEWIPADQGSTGASLPFNLDGWISNGDGIEYDGYLTRDGESVEAWEGYFPENTIRR